MKPRIFVWVGGLRGGFEQRTLEFCDFLRNKYHITPTIALYAHWRKESAALPYPKLFIRQILPDFLLGFANLLASLRLSFSREVKAFDICFGKYLDIKPVTVTRVAGDIRAWYRNEKNIFVKAANFLVEKAIASLIRNADMVTTSSDQAKDYAYSLGVKRILPSSDFVDTKVFSPAASRMPRHHFNIIFIGRSHESSKNLENLITACRRIEAVKLHIAGMDGENDKQVTYHGWCSRRKLASLLKRMHLCASPSYYETFGITVIEALACNTPVIASRNVPVARQIKGMLLTDTDADSIEQNIRIIMESYPAVVRKTHAMHKQVVRTFAKDRILKNEIETILRTYETYS